MVTYKNAEEVREIYLLQAINQIYKYYHETVASNN